MGSVTQQGRDTGSKAPARSAAAVSHDATRLYLSEIGVSPLLTADEEKYYARRAQRGDEKARHRMIERWPRTW